MDVGQALLHDPEDGGFSFPGQPAHGLVVGKANFNLAAFGEAIHIPGESGSQPGLVQQRRMQQVRHGAQLAGEFIDEENAIGDRPAEIGT